MKMTYGPCLQPLGFGGLLPYHHRKDVKEGSSANFEVLGRLASQGNIILKLYDAVFVFMNQTLAQKLRISEP